MELKKQDYEEPCCPLKKPESLQEGPRATVPEGRIMQKEDELLAREQYGEAVRLLDYWMKEAKALGDRRGEFFLLGEQMGLFRKLNRKEEALAAAAAGLAMIPSLGYDNSLSGATCLINAATVYKAFDRAEEALPLYEKAQEIYEARLPQQDDRRGGLYNNRGLALAACGRYSEAEECFAKALQVMEAIPGGQPEAAITRLNRADLFYARDGYQAAMEPIEEELSAAEALLNSPGLTVNGNLVYVLEKCAPVFDFYGWAETAEQLRKRAADGRTALAEGDKA